jgi:hypothetical protein
LTIGWAPLSLAAFARRFRSPLSLAAFARRFRSPLSLAAFGRRRSANVASEHAQRHEQERWSVYSIRTMVYGGRPGSLRAVSPRIQGRLACREARAQGVLRNRAA